MSSQKSTRKKLAKKFKVGDIVTWGNKQTKHEVLEVTKDGVMVCGEPYCKTILIPFVTEYRYGLAIGPPEHLDP